MKGIVSSRGSQAWTLAEILGVIAILAILATLLTVAWKRVPSMVDKVRCMSNLRSLHTSFESYLQDKGHWPQQPDFGNNQHRQYEDWWIEEMKPYGATEKVWVCTGAHKLSQGLDEKNRVRMSYFPTMFDANPMTPHRWSTQPWLVENANIHGKGPLICFPDGSIKQMDELLQ